MALRAVGFDIDGTLYPNYRFYARLLPWLALNLPLLLSMGKARDELRARRHEGPFYQLQAEFAAAHLKRPADEVRVLFDEKIYRGWTPLFSRVRPYAHAARTLRALRAAGLALGALSDFPALDKLERLGLGGLWDCAICSEEVGRLKPAPEPFLALAEALGAAPSECLYVGNSIRYDAVGAKAVGMMTAIVAPDPHRRSRARAVGADFVFSDYRHLGRWILSLPRS